MKVYITFGQVHRHVIRGTVFDRDCVAVMDESEVEYAFGNVYANCYVLEPEMGYYPRGLIEVDTYYRDDIHCRGCEQVISEDSYFTVMTDEEYEIEKENTNGHYCGGSERCIP